LICDLSAPFKVEINRLQSIVIFEAFPNVAQTLIRDPVAAVGKSTNV